MDVCLLNNVHEKNRIWKSALQQIDGEVVPKELTQAHSSNIRISENKQLQLTKLTGSWSNSLDSLLPDLTSMPQSNHWLFAYIFKEESQWCIIVFQKE